MKHEGKLRGLAQGESGGCAQCAPVRSQSQSAHDPARPPALLRPHSLLLDYVDEPDKFPKATIHPLERLLQWVIQNELSSRV